MIIHGTITHEDISGGFWGVIGDDGRKFRPVNELPEAFQKVGLKVKIEANPAPGFSIFMWGQEIEVSHIEAVTEEKPTNC